MQNSELTQMLVNSIFEKEQLMILISKGYSMYPLIKERDRCFLVKCNTDQIKRGDILLFEGKDGDLILHRFFGYINTENNKYVFKGDSNREFDYPISEDKILAKLDKIERKSRVINLNLLPFIIYGKLLTRFQFLSWFLHIIVKIRSKLTKIYP